MKTGVKRFSRSHRLAGYTAMAAGVCATDVDAALMTQFINDTLDGDAGGLHPNTQALAGLGIIRFEDDFGGGGYFTGTLSAAFHKADGGLNGGEAFQSGELAQVHPATGGQSYLYLPATYSGGSGAADGVNYAALTVGGKPGWLKFSHPDVSSTATNQEVFLHWFVYENDGGAAPTLGEAAAVPEPSSMLLFACSMLGVLRRRRSSSRMRVES